MAVAFVYEWDTESPATDNFDAIVRDTRMADDPPTGLLRIASGHTGEGAFRIFEVVGDDREPRRVPQDPDFGDRLDRGRLGGTSGAREFLRAASPQRRWARMNAATAAVDLAASVVDAGAGQLAASGGVESDQVVAYDVAHAAAAVECARGADSQSREEPRR